MTVLTLRDAAHRTNFLARQSVDEADLIEVTGVVVDAVGVEVSDESVRERSFEIGQTSDNVILEERSLQLTVG